MAFETDENRALAERLQELLRAAWPKHMTSTELTDQCGLRHRTWVWCGGETNRCMVTNPRRHVHAPSHHPPTDYRSAVDADGNLLGWDEYEVDVSLQQVNPALNKLHKRNLVVKQAPRPGSRSVLWFAVDHGMLEEHEAEAMEILRQTLLRASRPPELVEEPHGEPGPEPETPAPGFFERLVFC